MATRLRMPDGTYIKAETMNEAMCGGMGGLASVADDNAPELGGDLGLNGHTIKAVIDKGWLEVSVIVRGPLSASGILCGNLTMIHNLSATGLAAIPAVVMQQNSGGVDVTVANLKLSLVLTTGASEVITIQQVIADTMNL